MKTRFRSISMQSHSGFFSTKRWDRPAAMTTATFCTANHNTAPFWKRFIRMGGICASVIGANALGYYLENINADPEKKHRPFEKI